MRKLIVAAILAVSLVLVTVPTVVSAVKPPKEDNKKVFVCKYVGTPGVDETLQTGQNPISVSVNAIQNWDGTIPGYFSDQHGRSYVLEYDEGQDEPDVTECPDGDSPEVLAASAVVLTIDATCEVGETLVYGDIENASFSGTADGTTGPDSYLVTATADQNAEFDDQGTQELVFEGDLAGPLDDVSCDDGDVLGEEDPETTPVLPTTSGQGGTIALVSGASLLALAAAAGARRLLTRSI
jgi:hypothetical protein